MNTNIIANKDNNFSKNILILGGADGIGFAISKVYEKLNYKKNNDFVCIIFTYYSM